MGDLYLRSYGDRGTDLESYHKLRNSRKTLQAEVHQDLEDWICETMNEEELVKYVNLTIIGLEEHFVEEDCEGFYTFGCMSCTALRVIQDLKSLLELIEDE